MPDCDSLQASDHRDVFPRAIKPRGKAVLAHFPPYSSNKYLSFQDDRSHSWDRQVSVPPGHELVTEIRKVLREQYFTDLRHTQGTCVIIGRSK